MKTQSRPSVVCCAALFLTTVPPMAGAASKTLALADAEPQYASKFCWAAADVLAVNQFYPHCPPPASMTSSTPKVFPTSQALEAGNLSYAKSGISNPTLSQVRSSCEDNIQECNDWGFSVLNGLSYLPVPSNQLSAGLKWDTVTQEIDNGRPFLFVWKYTSDELDPSSPVDSHELVATGYSDERDSSHTQYLQIWDPWPVPSPTLPVQALACGPANGFAVDPLTSPHSQWIPFSTYTDPSTNDMGVVALHADDQWHLLPWGVPQPPVLTVEQGPPTPIPPPPLHGPSHRSSMPLPQVSFAEALNAAVPQSRQLDLQVSAAAPRTLGVPFPIVGLGFQQLLRAQGDPTALLAGNTSAILFPVVSEGKVVDAFLMLFTERRWQRGGYANVEITQRLVAVRESYATQHNLSLDSFYMVSVPGEVAFFAAYGKGKQAVLIPASPDPTIGAVPGVAVPADKQLRSLIKVIQHDLQVDRRRAAVRLRR